MKKLTSVSKKHESKKLLNALNKAYSLADSVKEETLRENGKKYYAGKVLERDADH
ncbi:MAG: hypothetical protein M1508_00290 [Nitrospirae bacterium]|nr:hypothetical protein [Nitrospirota bacterium]